MADARVSQVVVETLILPAPPTARLTQLVVEILASTTAAPVTATTQPFILLPV